MQLPITRNSSSYWPKTTHSSWQGRRQRRAASKAAQWSSPAAAVTRSYSVGDELDIPEEVQTPIHPPQLTKVFLNCFRLCLDREDCADDELAEFNECIMPKRFIYKTLSKFSLNLQPSKDLALIKKNE